MSSDAKKLPVLYQPDPSRPTDAFHHTHEWASGTRGGGAVPADLEWRTNPKQWQEEKGLNTPSPTPG